MRLDEMLRRRSYPGMGTEPAISYIYRKLGFFFSIHCVSLILFIGSIATITMVPAFSALFGYAILGGIVGILFLFIGVAVSEGWAASIVRYSPSASGYRKRQLIISFIGVVGVSVLVIVAAYLYSVF